MPRACAHDQANPDTLMRLAQDLLAFYARHAARTRAALLLPIQSTVAARHLLPLARLAHELGIATCYTLSSRVAHGPDAPDIHRLMSAHALRIGTARAHATRWTLIVVADHGHFRPLLRTGAPVAHIGHGNPSKTDAARPDLPWEYGHAPRTRRGDIAYREMIEASDRVRDAIIATEPSLAPRIRVLGRLIDDEMLRQRRGDRAAMRHRLGLDPQRPVLLAVSTLRANSLFGRYWDALLPPLRNLASRYQVLLCPHPHERGTWSARLGTDPLVRLLPAGLGAEQALAAADMLIVDFSSLCQKAALLGIPMVLAHCDPLPVWSHGATLQLYAHWPVWDGSTDLQSLVAQAGQMGNPATHADIMDWINSRRGEARILFAAWLRSYFPSAASSRPERP